MLAYLSIAWIAIALALLVHRRRQLAATLRRLPVPARVALAVLLVACAFIPGPVDDLIVVALIARLAKEN